VPRHRKRDRAEWVSAGSGALRAASAGRLSAVLGTLVLILSAAACAGAATVETASVPAPPTVAPAATAESPARPTALEVPAASGATGETGVSPTLGAATSEPGAPLAPPSADDVPRINAQDLKALLDAGARVVIVDVRSSDSYYATHIAGAISLPGSDLEERYQELPRTQDIVIYCT